MMNGRRKSYRRRTILVVTAVFGVLAAATAPVPAPADDLPTMRQGMWKFERTVAGKKTEVTKCTDPTEDMKKQNAMLKKSGCKFSPVRKSGNVYTFTADCMIKGPSGSGTTVRSTSIMTVGSDRAYRIEIDAVTDGVSTKEVLVAQRIGDCK